MPVAGFNPAVPGVEIALPGPDDLADSGGFVVEGSAGPVPFAGQASERC